jgi:hypothetical protein
MSKMKFLRLETEISQVEYSALIGDTDYCNCLAWVLNDTLFLYGDTTFSNN